MCYNNSTYLLIFFIFLTEMAEYMSYVRRLDFTETPNYVYLRSLFTTALHKNGLEDDQCFDWKDKLLVRDLKPNDYRFRSTM